MKNVVVGTAGHIDHGKTTLIKALTGRETDTLAEEKSRGISINLGFTYFDISKEKRIGIVDVPGHEKFIKNMLAGASGIDIVLLVIAADEGVMPQTIEHIDILSYLNIKNGMVVLTKSDTVDEDFRELVKEDIKDVIKGTFLENADIIEVDSISKKGLDKLIKKIDEMSDEIDGKNENSPARLNIDRVFSIKGFGTVVTGTLLEGTVSVDDELIVYPQNIKTKIRSIQVHGKSVEKAYAGQRTAINISNVKVDDIDRGDVLAAPNSLEEAMMLDTKISLVNHSEKTLKHWDRLRLYHGTREILCRAVPLDKEIIESGESGYVQLRLEESIVSKKGDVFVLRYYSPMNTIGGGVIIDTSPKKHKRFDEKVIETLKVKEKGELKDIIEEYLKRNLKNYPNLKEIMTYTGEHEDIVLKSLKTLLEEGKVLLINNMYLHISEYEKIKLKAINLLTEYHKKYRLRNGILKEELRSKLDTKFKTREMDILLERISGEDLIKIVENTVSLKDFKVVLNDKQKEIYNIIEKRLKECKTETILTMDEVCDNNNYKEVLDSMMGKVAVNLDDTYVMHKDIYLAVKQTLIDYIKEYNEITLGEYRDLINSSRKNCMIILENFDRNKITKRVENKRVLI